MAIPFSRPIGSSPANRREALRQLGLVGLGLATAGGTAALWSRAIGDMRSSASRGGTPVSHQLGWLKGVQFGGTFMADAQGYFDRENLNVDLAAGGVSTDYRTLVASGSTMVSEANIIAMINGRLQQQPLVAFAAVFQRDAACIASMPGKPILSLADMLDKTICVPNVVRGQISSLLRREGYDPHRVRFVPGGTDASLLIEGEVDGIYEWATRLKPAMDAVGISASYLHLADVGAPGYAQLLFARRDRVEQHFDLFVRYTRALVDGWQWMVNYPVETARLVCDSYAPPGTDLARQTAEAKLMRSYITDGDGSSRGLLWVNPDPFEQAIRLAYDAGDIPRGVKITPDDLMTSKVVEAVHAKS